MPKGVTCHLQGTLLAANTLGTNITQKSRIQRAVIMALVLTAHGQLQLPGPETHSHKKQEMSSILNFSSFPSSHNGTKKPTAGNDPNISVGKGLLWGLMKDLEEPLVASLVKTSSCVGKVCTSHGNQVVPPARLLSTDQPQACSTPRSPCTLT